MKIITAICLIAIIGLSCNNGYPTKYPYSIKDYSKDFQPWLLKALNLGMYGYDSAYLFLNAHASTKELKKLTLCEHPALRMLALKVLIYKEDLDHYPIIMDHLDDSAMIATDEGEWGIGMKTVTDYMLERAGWETKEKRNEAADVILLQHNNFHCAYSILRVLHLDEKYYQSVKEMVQRKERHYETEIDMALYYLARFQKKEDIPLIKKILRENISWLSDYSFRLMREFPDDSYLDVLDYYAKHQLRQDMRSQDYHHFTIDDFFKTLPVYKNQRAADLLSYIIKYLGTLNLDCIYMQNDYKGVLYETICDNNCDAYAAIIPIVEPVVMKTYKNRFFLQMDVEPFEVEEEKEKYNWHF